MDANEILKTKKSYAVVGVSQDETKYGYEVFSIMLKYHYEVFPVNPKYSEIAGHTCYPSVHALPKEPEVIILVMAPQNTEKMIDNLSVFKNAIFWLPPECWSDMVITLLKQLKMKYIYDVCPIGKLKGF